jgi:transcriptional regulator with XRE-family HTH domain
MMKPIPSLSEQLREARRNARLSQLELALRMQVSQRHISYVEGGRAKPSRELLVDWLQVLHVPMSLRNAVMQMAGYSPIYSETRLDAPSLMPAQAALTALLESHDPMPCFVLDSDWNLLQSNNAGKWLSAMLIPDLAAAMQSSGINMLDVLIHPEGFTKNLLNIEEVGPKFLDHLREEALLNPSLEAKVQKFSRLVDSRLFSKVDNPRLLHRELSPLLISRFKTDHGELAFFSMFTTFGRPQDVTLASLRVEHLFAADERTKRVLIEQVS